jgi:hypothetical protein
MLTPVMRVPCAIASDGKMCFAATTRKTRGPFKCAGCSAPVILKQGNVKVFHFAHKATSDVACNEGMRHRSTKEWIAELAHRPDLRIKARCPHCGADHTVFRGYDDFKGIVECPVDSSDQKRKYVVDCLIHNGRRPVAFIEIRDTHATGSSKLKWLESRSNNNTPAVEVLAVDLVEAGFPVVWNTIDHRPCLLCVTERCAINRASRTARKDRLVRKIGLRWLAAARRNIKTRHVSMLRRWRATTRMHLNPDAKWLGLWILKEWTECVKCKGSLFIADAKGHKWHASCYPTCPRCGDFVGGMILQCPCYSRPQVHHTYYSCVDCDDHIETDKYGGRCYECNVDRREKRQRYDACGW